jgi:hypothetical protein
MAMRRMIGRYVKYSPLSRVHVENPQSKPSPRTAGSDNRQQPTRCPIKENTTILNKEL